MSPDTFHVAPSDNHANVYFIFRQNGSEIKVLISHTDQNFSNAYPIGDNFLISPVMLTDQEIQHFHQS